MKVDWAANRFTHEFLHDQAAQHPAPMGPDDDPRNIMQLFRNLSRHLESGRLDELTLTTNGSQLTKYADELVACRVRRHPP